MENELNDATKKEERTISVSISSASSILPIMISKFNQTSPDTHFMIMQNPASSNHNDFSADFNFFSTTSPINNDHTVTLLKEDLLLAIPQNYPQASQNSVKLADFSKYFGFTSMCRIESTYRFAQPAIDISSTFIQKNASQVKKNVKSPKKEALTTIT